MAALCGTAAMTMSIIRATIFSLYLDCFTLFTDFILLGVDPDALDQGRGVGSSSVDPPRLLHVSNKTAHELPLINSYTDPDYFTAVFLILFLFGIGGHLGDTNRNRPKAVSIQTFTK
jgi:hypothetical protein